MNCLRCGKTAEIQTERGDLCNACDCYRLECLNNVEQEKTEEDFWNEIPICSCDDNHFSCVGCLKCDRKMIK